MHLIDKMKINQTKRKINFFVGIFAVLLSYTNYRYVFVISLKRNKSYLKRVFAGADPFFFITYFQYNF
jgi:hypothetical protein